ncbi:pectin lyase fold/virulence factor, partial [Boeremia exigua]|uniref:pectin lyase fold/virulence factor n=1 Tax=Boeremia exigua TaxID=749465 RepID=UPI001E8DD65F
MSLLSINHHLRLFILFTALLLFAGPAISVPSYKTGHDDDKGVIRVKHGESIQAAIDRAKPYTRIEVEGEHRERVVIKKDGISLIGKGAKLSPPSEPDSTKNYCYGKVKVGTDPNPDNLKNVSAGICIHGRDIKLKIPYEPAALHWRVEDVGNPVKDVSVSGFEISDFDGENIAVYGGKDTKISRNKLKGGLRYGFLTVGSKGTEAWKNKISGTPGTLRAGEIAMCMDDRSSAVFSENVISSYFIGLCTETDDGFEKENNIRDCCIGIVIDPTVRNAKAINNDIAKWNPGCSPDASAGISLLGAKNALVKGNKISIGSSPPLTLGAGIFMGFEVEFGAVNEGNTITKNVFGKNPADIYVDSTGTNYIFNNTCDLPLRAPGTPAPEFCQPRGRA